MSQMHEVSGMLNRVAYEPICFIDSFKVIAVGRGGWNVTQLGSQLPFAFP